MNLYQAKTPIRLKSINVWLLVVLSIYFIIDIQAQQDPQYTQYMYNTMSVNPAYVGSKGHTVITGLGRTQWVGFEGAPDTQVISYDTPLGYDTKLGLGFNLVNDQIGPSHELFLDVNVAYAVETGVEGNLALGLKLGGRLLNIDWNIGNLDNKSDASFKDIGNKLFPTVGAGIYYYEPEWYVGLAVPNFLYSEHYDDNLKSTGDIAVERLHFFLIAGYVFDINESTKFKPAALFKGVSGAPLSLDISANFLFDEQFRVGLAWRWGDAISGLLGFQASESLHIGYAYDLTTSNYNVANSGTHEIMLRYEIFKQPRLKSPRFF